MPREAAKIVRAEEEIAGRKPEVLFLSPDASGTGAPYVLLLLLGWLKANTPFRLRLVLGRGGPREDDFRALAPTYVVETGESPLVRHLLGIARSTSWRLHRTLSLRLLRSYARRHPASLVYANTIASGELLPVVAMPGVPVVTHVHELRGLFEECRREGSLDYTLRRTDHFIAVAAAVKQEMVQVFGVSPDRVDVCYEFVPCERFSEVRVESAARKARALIGARPGDLLFAGCGTLSTRKGADLFLTVARRVREDTAMKGSHFLWVGGNASGSEYAALVEQTERLGVQDHVHFLGHRTDYLDFLAAADVFLLTSREDPFPLVVLEAAGFAKPILCFEGSGGAPEFVRSDAGVCVPLGDAEAMAAAAISLAQAPARRAALGAAGRQRVFESHCVNGGAARIHGTLRKLLPQGSPDGSCGA
jgi:glycosyltransferase involved in cell wall biosynthesis